jgi:Ca2+-binding EF-hand superfamily protein
MSRSNPVKRIFNHFFAVVFVMEFTLVSVWIGVMLAWSLLAAILEPRKNLKHLVMLSVLISVVVSIKQEMLEAARKLRDRVLKAANFKMQAVLRQIKEKTEQDIQKEVLATIVHGVNGSQEETRKVKKVRPVKVDASKDDFDAYHQQLEERLNPHPVTPAEVFELLDTDRDNKLDAEEFATLFANFPDMVSQSHVEHLFAFHDVDGDGSITLQEFEEGWDFMLETIVELTVKSSGLSTRDIVWHVVTAVIGLLSLFAFIGLAMQSWYSNSDIDSLVQTFLIFSSGKLVLAFRKRAPKEMLDEDKPEEGQDDG